MAGLYTEGISEVLSGVYSIIKAAVSSVAAGTRGIVAYPFTANWGPANKLVSVDSASEYKAFYNPGGELTSGKIYTHAYRGKPKRIKAYRMTTASAAKGTVTLQDAGSTKSLELETLYPSSRPFTVIVKAGISGGKVVEIVENGIKLFSAEGATVDQLAAALDTSDYVRVKSKGVNVPKDTAGTAFAGGNDGSAVTATEYAAFLDEMEADREANVFALDGVTDEGILTTAAEWTKRVRDEGFYISFVRGGGSAWDTDLSAAHTVSKALNHRAIVNVGNGCEGLTAADLAIFVAARKASVALNATLTDEPIPYSSVNKKYKLSERKTAKLSGTLIFVQDGDKVLIDEGVNTLTVPGAGESKEYGKIRINNTLDHIIKDLEAFGEAYKRERSNTQEARETYAATVEETYLKPLVAMEVIQPGYFYRPDPDYHGKDAVFKPALDEAYFYSDITPVDSMERIYQKMYTRF